MPRWSSICALFLAVLRSINLFGQAEVLPAPLNFWESIAKGDTLSFRVNSVLEPQIRNVSDIGFSIQLSNETLTFMGYDYTMHPRNALSLSLVEIKKRINQDSTWVYGHAFAEHSKEPRLFFSFLFLLGDSVLQLEIRELTQRWVYRVKPI